jgi:hypothetical protein
MMIIDAALLASQSIHHRGTGALTAHYCAACTVYIKVYIITNIRLGVVGLLGPRV